jgi:hypothetical protein
MYAIISEIDPHSSTEVAKIWGELSQVCGLREIYTLPTPHFTWLVAEELALEEANSILSSMIVNTPKIATFTSGLGIFSGEYPVLFLPMVKSIEMIHLHQKIWEQLGPCCKEKNKYYSPSFWLPHITLALKDLNKENLTCAVNLIAFEQIELSVLMTSIAIAEHQIGQNAQILERYNVGD